MNLPPITIVGGGLAGCEAAWQIASRCNDCPVVLYDMKPHKKSPAHQDDNLCELVCSNSLGADNPSNAKGILVRELRAAGSLIISMADAARIPAGKALAVDRRLFAEKITRKLQEITNIKIIPKEITEIPDAENGPVILATGPLTAPTLAAHIERFVGEKYLSFFDAVSPVVHADSIDFNKAFTASRYDAGMTESGDYVNLPFDETQYYKFVELLRSADSLPFKPFENPSLSDNQKIPFFEGCVPIEVLASRGKMTPAFGPMKPKGLIDPKTGKEPFAVVQLRREDREGRLFNLVGFQTKLSYADQKRIFRQIPGLEKAVFARLGKVHANLFINSPALLNASLAFRKNENIFAAGQITGVEGYLESAASGAIAGINALNRAHASPAVSPPANSMIGALIAHITDPFIRNFQPMNVNIGLLPNPPYSRPKKSKKMRRIEKGKLALNAFQEWLKSDVPLLA